MAEGPSILVVDDELKICQFLEVLLKREGYRVSSVQNASDALQRIERETHDLIITDLRMPGMDGFELVNRAKALREDMPIIMVTGYATVKTAVKAMRHGVDDYVTKPFNLDELRKVIGRTLQAVQMKRDNAELLERLKKANTELERHRKQLASKVQKTDSELESTRTVLEDHRGQLAMFNQLGELISTERNLNRLLNEAISAINKRLTARSSSVMLREGDSLVVRACLRDCGDDLTGLRQPMDEGVTGYVARMQQPFLISDLGKDPVFRPTPKRGYETSSFICVPILQRGKTLGVINVADKEDGSPFDKKDMEAVVSVANQVAPAVENADLYRALEESCLSAIEALANTLEAKDRYTSGHSLRVGSYAISLAKAVGAGPIEIEFLKRAAHLHDIGKIGLSDLILNKPSKLTSDEIKLVRSHPSIGEHIVESLDFLEPVRSLIRHHHERVDGGGYPDGLEGKEIPHLARMLAIADAFDAMTSERPYRTSMKHDAALGEIRSGAGSQFDEDLSRAFCEKIVLSNGTPGN